MPLYDSVVDAVRAAHGFELGDPGFEDYLRSLLPALRKLRLSYRPGGSNVAITYDESVSEAYLLAYYPHYVRMSWDAVCRHSAAIVPRDSHRFGWCGFGSGPCPEVLAVGRLVADNHRSVRELDLSSFDIASDEWSWARAISVERLLPTYFAHDTEMRAVDVDITAAGMMGPIAAFIAGADLVQFQNCLNEFIADEERLRDNVATLLASMQSGAVLTMVDLNNYPTARQCLQVVEEVAGNSVDVLQRPDQVVRMEPFPAPLILRQHFFREDQWPRKWPLTYRCFAARVR